MHEMMKSLSIGLYGLNVANRSFYALFVQNCISIENIRIAKCVHYASTMLHYKIINCVE